MYSSIEMSLYPAYSSLFYAHNSNIIIMNTLEEFWLIVAHFQIDMKKVRLELMRPYLTNILSTPTTVEDEVMVEYVFSQLEEKQHPDGKLIQIMMTGFLGKTKARTFMGELWSTLVEAQNSPHGIPAELIELKREEMQKKKVRARVKLATNRIFNSKAVICYEYQF